jgi:hypothetical protein
MLEMIDHLVETPTEENKNEFLKSLYDLEYSILEKAESLPKKSQEYFNTRAEAFSIRSKYAKILLAKWVSKFSSTEGCPLKYEDTLNIPFRQIKRK